MSLNESQITHISLGFKKLTIGQILELPSCQLTWTLLCLLSRPRRIRRWTKRVLAFRSIGRDRFRPSRRGPTFHSRLAGKRSGHCCPKHSAWQKMPLAHFLFGPFRSLGPSAAWEQGSGPLRRNLTSPWPVSNYFCLKWNRYSLDSFILFEFWTINKMQNSTTLTQQNIFYIVRFFGHNFRGFTVIMFNLTSLIDSKLKLTFAVQAAQKACWQSLHE